MIDWTRLVWTMIYSSLRVLKWSFNGWAAISDVSPTFDKEHEKNLEANEYINETLDYKPLNIYDPA